MNLLGKNVVLAAIERLRFEVNYAGTVWLCHVSLVGGSGRDPSHLCVIMNCNDMPSRVTAYAVVRGKLAGRAIGTPVPRPLKEVIDAAFVECGLRV